MVSSSSSKANDLLVLLQVLTEILGSEGRTLIRHILRGNNSIFTAEVFECVLGIKSLMRVEMSLEFNLDQTACCIHKNASTTIHIVCVGTTTGLELNSLGRTNKVVN